ncbi:MAG: hypothetical protein OQL09_03680 [Gammaproteobacteria bacterium]|nr:hypothetical protein [Gammaproteobacteria bacterium]
MKILSIFIVLLSLIACSSDYSPSEAMLKYKQNMSQEQAQSVLQDAIWRDAGPVSVCASRGFWYDEGANFRIGTDKISLLAYRKGKFIRSEGQGFERQDYYEKQYYDYDFIFSDMQHIGLYEDASLLTGYKSCHKLDANQNIIVVDLFVSDKSNIKFTVIRDDLDKVAAALSILLPDMKIKRYKKFGS